MSTYTPVNFGPWAAVDLSTGTPEEALETNAPVHDRAEREQAAGLARAWAADEGLAPAVLTPDALPGEGVELTASDEQVQARELAAAWAKAETA